MSSLTVEETPISSMYRVLDHDVAGYGEWREVATIRWEKGEWILGSVWDIDVQSKKRAISFNRWPPFGSPSLRGKSLRELGVPNPTPDNLQDRSFDSRLEAAVNKYIRGLKDDNHA